MLDDVKLSDLFFNHEHPEYDRLFKEKKPPTRDQMEDALLKDANEFSNQFPEFGKDGTWYYHDFFRRL